MIKSTQIRSYFKRKCLELEIKYFGIKKSIGNLFETHIHPKGESLVGG